MTIEKNKGIVEIDAELLRQMRLNGQGFEATQLLKAYYKDLEKIKLNAKNEFVSINRKIKKLKGICIVDYCMNEAVIKGKCVKHYKQYKKWKEEAKSRIR